MLETFRNAKFDINDQSVNHRFKIDYFEKLS